MDDGIDVWLAAAEDAGAATRLVSALLVELGAGSLPPATATAAFDVMVSDPGTGFAVLGGSRAAPIAVCTVSFVHALRSLGRYAVIQEMYVDPSARGGGVGRAVLDRALAECRERGCAFVELGTPTDGARQIAFYERAGFSNVGARLRWLPS
jgi:ribosomal protein S18 acetylase RimI-like enzyme